MLWYSHVGHEGNPCQWIGSKKTCETSVYTITPRLVILDRDCKMTLVDQAKT